jgi:hypothetical protein
MLVDSSTGLDLNEAGVNLQGVDILMDLPQVLSVARVRYENGTRIEISCCGSSLDAYDIEAVRSHIPIRSMPLRGWPSETLGCRHDDEYTTAYWIFE